MVTLTLIEAGNGKYALRREWQTGSDTVWVPATMTIAKAAESLEAISLARPCGGRSDG